MFDVRNSIMFRVGLLLALAGLFLLAHPYGGVRHDGELYLGQALYRLHPDIFSHDVFFRFGSQEQFSIFGRLYAIAIEQLGVGKASVLLTLLSQAGFFIALIVLARRVSDKTLWPWAVVFFSVSTGIYGGEGVFRIAEPFVTGRPFAETLVVLAIAFLFVERRWIAAVFLVAASLLHPLQSIPGWMLWGVWQIQGDRRWVSALLLGVIPVGLGVLGIYPFNHLFESFDPQWRELLVLHSPQIFITSWHWADFLFVITDIAFILMATLIVTGKVRRLLVATLIVAGLGVGATLIFSDWLNNVLLGGLQLWRALWLAHLMAVLMVAGITRFYWSKGNAGKLVTALLIYAFILRGLPTGAGALLLGVLLAANINRWQISKEMTIAAISVLVVAVSIQWLNSVSRLLEVDESSQMHISGMIIQGLDKPWMLLCLGGLILFGLANSKFRVPATMLALAIFVVSLMSWDQRGPWSRMLEEGKQHPFAKLIDKNAEVLWYEKPLASWVLLQRRSYVSAPQSAGQMYNRKTAMEINRRKQAIDIFGFQTEICQIMNALNKRSDSCVPDTVTVREVCRKAGDLDFIVMPNILSVPPEAHWRASLAGSNWHEDYYLYNCNTLEKTKD